MLSPATSKTVPDLALVILKVKPDWTISIFQRWLDKWDGGWKAEDEDALSMLLKPEKKV